MNLYNLGRQTEKIGNSLELIKTSLQYFKDFLIEANFAFIKADEKEIAQMIKTGKFIFKRNILEKSDSNDTTVYPYRDNEVADIFREMCRSAGITYSKVQSADSESLFDRAFKFTIPVALFNNSEKIEMTDMTLNLLKTQLPKNKI